MSTADDLTEVLTGLGVDIHRVYNDEINARCPVHHLTKGRESSRRSWYLNVDSGLWHCFTCGARGNLSMLVSQLTNDPSALWEVQSHLIHSGLDRINSSDNVIEERPQVDWSQYSQFEPLPDRVINSHASIQRCVRGTAYVGMTTRMLSAFPSSHPEESCGAGNSRRQDGYATTQSVFIRATRCSGLSVLTDL